MKLLAMRSFDVNDPLPGLGEKVEPAKPAPAAPARAVPTGRPGVMRGPDGKLHTAIPVPPAALEPMWRNPQELRELKARWLEDKARGAKIDFLENQLLTQPALPMLDSPALQAQVEYVKRQYAALQEAKRRDALISMDFSALEERVLAQGLEPQEQEKRNAISEFYSDRARDGRVKEFTSTMSGGPAALHNLPKFREDAAKQAQREHRADIAEAAGKQRPPLPRKLAIGEWTTKEEVEDRLVECPPWQVFYAHVETGRIKRVA